MRLLAYREDEGIRTGVLSCDGIRPVDDPQGSDTLVEIAMNPGAVASRVPLVRRGTS